MHYEGSGQLGRGTKFLRELPWWKIRAAPQRANYHADASDFYNPYVAEMGDDILFYFTKVSFFYKKEKFTILNLEKDATYSYTFFDPITGRKYPKGKAELDENGNWVVPEPPIMQDWVVHVHRER
jgi:hypothetical protein